MATKKKSTPKAIGSKGKSNYVPKSKGKMEGGQAAYKRVKS